MGKEGQVSTVCEEAERSLYCFRTSSKQVGWPLTSIQLYPTAVFWQLSVGQRLGAWRWCQDFPCTAEAHGRPWSAEGEGHTHLYLNHNMVWCSVCVDYSGFPLLLTENLIPLDLSSKEKFISYYVTVHPAQLGSCLVWFSGSKMSFRILSQSLMSIFHSVSAILKLSPTQVHVEFHSSFSFSRSSLKSRGAAFSQWAAHLSSCTFGLVCECVHIWIISCSQGSGLSVWTWASNPQLCGLHVGYMNVQIIIWKVAKAKGMVKRWVQVLESCHLCCVQALRGRVGKDR